ncbi:MAG: sulfate transporter CysZ [Plesiomonas sp.]|uniref:sulfate transporter CysZ n=2 Tax=Plesiomonas sp. TaxID=2486279 RepID=UPI003EE72B01
MSSTTKTKMTENGVTFFLQGWKLAFLPGIRRYVILPLLVNVLLIGSAFYWLASHMQAWIGQLLSHIPDWLQWLNYLLWPLAVISVLLLFGYFFSTLANIIASPFNGLLAEQLEAHLTGEEPPVTGVMTLLRDVPRILKREVRKLVYYLPKVIALLLVSLIPVVGQTLAPLLWLLLTAWMLAVQYSDYPFDNHKIPFTTMRDALKQRRFTSITFGGLISICTMVPLLNLVIMPVAVCGATAMWVACYRPQLKGTGAK